MRRTPVLAILLMMAIHITYGQRSTSNTRSDEVAIRLDNVVFAGGEYMSVLNSANQVIAYYDRFENQSGPVKSMRVFDAKKNLKYELVPLITDMGFEIHIRDSKKARGLLDLTASLNGFKINYRSEVDYFGKPYDFNFDTRLGIGKVSIEESVQYNGKDVISNQTKVSALSGIDISPILVDRTFYTENEMDVANWVLIMELLKELSLESSKYNDSRNVRQ